MIVQTPELWNQKSWRIPLDLNNLLNCESRNFTRLIAVTIVFCKVLCFDSYFSHNWSIQKTRSISIWKLVNLRKCIDFIYPCTSHNVDSYSLWHPFDHSRDFLCQWHCLSQNSSIANSRRVSVALCMEFYCSVLYSNSSFPCLSNVWPSCCFFSRLRSIGVRKIMCVASGRKQKAEESDQSDNSIAETLKLSPFFHHFSLFW